jgi:hypothetical protein
MLCSHCIVLIIYLYGLFNYTESTYVLLFAPALFMTLPQI